MAKYRKKPVVIEATQWFRLGDHPSVNCKATDVLNLLMVQVNRPDIPLEIDKNGNADYGVIETLEGSYIVSPGDWIITGIKGERYPIKDEIFQITYEPVASDESESDGS